MENYTILNNLLKSEIALWGEDYINDLLEQGYEPTLVTDGHSVKLVWRLTNGDSYATLESGRFYSRLSGSAD
jgi:hypothetical protein